MPSDIKPAPKKQTKKAIKEPPKDAPDWSELDKLAPVKPEPAIVEPVVAETAEVVPALPEIDKLVASMPKVESVEKLAPKETPAPEMPEELPKLKPKASVKTKPMVEGINAPKSTSDIVYVSPVLTDKEKKLISEIGVPGEPQEPEQANNSLGSGLPGAEPRLLPTSVTQRMNKKSLLSKRFVISTISILVLAFGGYGLYGVYLNQSAAPENKTEVKATSTLKVKTALSDENGSSSPNTTLSVATTTPVVSTSTPDQKTSPVVPAPASKVKISPTPNGFLNFRKGPSLSYPVITKVHPGEVYTFTTKQTGWYRILLPDGRAGWVIGQYVTEQ